MNKPQYLELLRLDGEALARAAAKDLNARVPSCPDWDMAALVVHTGQVHRHKAAIVRSGERERPDDLEIEPGPDDPNALIDWYLDGLEALIQILSKTDEDAAVWTWGTDQHVAFWVRRMAQETAVHRWDAEAAVAEPQAIDSELAVDGVEEMLGEFVPSEAIPYKGAPGDLSLQCTDAGAGWTVHLKRQAVPTYNARTGPGAATLRGPASDVLLLLWRRIRLEDMRVTGKEDLARDFWSYMEGPGQ